MAKDRWKLTPVVEESYAIFRNWVPLGLVFFYPQNEGLEQVDLEGH